LDSYTILNLWTKLFPQAGKKGCKGKSPCKAAGGGLAMPARLKLALQLVQLQHLKKYFTKIKT
jgi:hypothetical protein